MLKELRDGWDEAARTDPLYHILTEGDKANGGWDRAAFFERGRSDVAQLLGRLEESGFAPKRGVALDFGCGVGRCTQALAASFKTTYGVDISPQMIRLARRYDKQGRCIFRANGSQRLKAFSDDSCDFVYSQFVLQHMNADLQRSYIREFLRVLRPNGVGSFNLSESGTHRDPAAPWRAMYAPYDLEACMGELPAARVPTDNGLFWTVRKVAT